MLPALRIWSSASSSPTLNPTKFPSDPSRRLPKIPSCLVRSSADGLSRARIPVLCAASRDGSPVKELDESPVSVQLQPIDDRNFDRVIAEAQQLDESVVIVWMASWCRKCIFLKPKLEKLAADYSPRLRFYCVDVNKVPHKLVAQAGVTKMPTVQVWKDGNKQAEVIGGLKAHFVINEVREMIESESDP